MKRETCINCKWWEKCKYDGAYDATNPYLPEKKRGSSRDYSVGECKINAPVVCRTTESLVHYYGDSVWPWVFSDDWCGQFESSISHTQRKDPTLCEN